MLERFEVLPLWNLPPLPSVRPVATGPRRRPIPSPAVMPRLLTCPEWLHLPPIVQARATSFSSAEGVASMLWRGKFANLIGAAPFGSLTRATAGLPNSASRARTNGIIATLFRSRIGATNKASISSSLGLKCPLLKALLIACVLSDDRSSDRARLVPSWNQTSPSRRTS